MIARVHGIKEQNIVYLREIPANQESRAARRRPVRIPRV